MKPDYLRKKEIENMEFGWAIKFIWIVQILVIVLKFNDYVDISWWYVFFPISFSLLVEYYWEKKYGYLDFWLVNKKVKKDIK